MNMSDKNLQGFDCRIYKTNKISVQHFHGIIKLNRSWLVRQLSYTTVAAPKTSTNAPRVTQMPISNKITLSTPILSDACVRGSVDVN